MSRLYRQHVLADGFGFFRLVEETIQLHLGQGRVYAFS
jgi:hypothetical protein